MVERLVSRWTLVHGRWLHARVSAPGGPADGPPVVLVHGLGVSSRYLLPTARQLATHGPVYVPDLPGFGRSEHPARALTIPELADALVRWLPTVGLERAAWVGHSVGGQVMVDLAARYPERVTRLVLAGATTDPAARHPLVQMWRWLLAASRERPSLCRVVARDALAMGLGRLIQTFRYVLQDPVEAKLPRIDAPTLVVRGEHDSLSPQRWAETMVRRLPRGQLVVIPGAAHAVNYSAPAAFAAVLEAFLYASGAPSRRVA